MTIHDEPVEPASIGLVYPVRDPRLATLARQLSAINSVWVHSLTLALDSEAALDGEQSDATRAFLRDREYNSRYDNDDEDDNQVRYTYPYLPRLRVERINLNSPLDLTLALPGGLLVPVLGYAIHLAIQILRDPTTAGAWLPRLVTGWYKGKTELYEQRRLTLKARSRALEDAGDNLIWTPASVTASGAGPIPEDLRGLTEPPGSR